ncbi:MAG: hypothetical protein GXY14_13275, partial [Spirochaetes bacterium]|nr:hypothetical protein [Spirochaetota bacterium]
MTQKRAIYTAAITAIVFFAGTAWSVDYGRIRFREFSSDRQIFERYTEEAAESISAEEWQSILDAGREEMSAGWERDALAERDRYIREGFDAGLVNNQMQEARAEWENNFNYAMLYDKGEWRAGRGLDSYSAGKMTALGESVTSGSTAGYDDAAAWERHVADAVHETESLWENNYAPEISSILKQAETLNGPEKNGFLAEAERIEKDMRFSFDMEKDTILYLGKNAFIEKINTRNMTLREESESRSASFITDSIIADTEAQVRAEHEKILERAYSPGSESALDFSGLGVNWQEDLKKLIEYGMGRWEAAREKLYNELASWKKSAEDAYKTAEAKWREGLQKLEAARLEWETKLAGEIYAGFDAWEAGHDELNLNIERSRQELSEYLERMSEHWDESNRDLLDMAVNGSAVYCDAVENINWLTEMKNSTESQYAFSSYDENFKKAIGQYLVNQIDAAIDNARSMFIIRNRSRENNNQSLEVVVTQAGKPGYNDATGTFTESYTITVVEHVYSKIESGGYFITGINTGTKETVNTLLSINWNNVVSLDSEKTRRTANCYYAFELARWEKIRTAFSTIARDAEFYMHERNMEGRENGAGYLTNEDGNYTVNADGSADPYLMTGAEYSLELAERDMDFWNRRLEIARSVLDYAEGRTCETSAQTKENMSQAKLKMDNAKKSYDNAIEAVNKILAELRNIQGLKPLTDDPDAWQRYYESYNSSIENLTKIYSNSEKALKAAEENYSKTRAAFITYKNMTGENGEARPVEYLKNEIIEIELNIIRAEESINRQRENLFIRQNEADFTSRTAGFAVLYSETVKNYEQAKGRINLFVSIMQGSEYEADVSARVNAIYENRLALWGDDADEFFAVLKGEVDAYNNAAEADRAEKKENVLSEIRGIYFSLNAEVDIYRKSLEMLRDKDFDHESFIDTEYIADHNVYAEYARYSAAAIDLIEEYFDDADAGKCDKSYGGAWGFLKAEFDKQRFVLGEDNSSYVIHYTALKYFEKRYRGITAETWGQYRKRLAAESDYADNAADIHEDMADGASPGTLLEMQELASEGEIEAVQYLREYYASGSAIPGLEYIKEYDARADIADYVNDYLKNYAIENCHLFIHTEKLQASYNYLADLYGFLAPSGLSGILTGDNLFSTESFRYMTPEQMSTASGLLQQYVARLEKSGMPVPESIRAAAAAMGEIKKDLDTELFIMSYMNNLLTGTAEEILAAAGNAVDAAETAYDFLQTCRESIEKGTSYNDIALRIISAYESLSESRKLEIDGNETSGESRVSNFIKNLYLYIYAIDLAESERIYIMNMGDASPADYASMLPVHMREQFIKDTTPAYERAQYDLAFSEGRVTSVDAYITTRNESVEIDDETEESLRNYALIKEYLCAAVKRPFSEQSFEVKVYLAEK